MITSTLQAVAGVQITEYKDFASVSLKLAEIGHLMAGLESEARRLASMREIDRLEFMQRGSVTTETVPSELSARLERIEAKTDQLSPLTSRVVAVEALTRAPAAPVASGHDALAGAIGIVADELSALKEWRAGSGESKGSIDQRLERLEAAILEIMNLTGGQHG